MELKFDFEIVNPCSTKTLAASQDILQVKCKIFLVTCKGASLKLHDKIFTWITMQVTWLIMAQITKISSRSLLN